MVKGEKTMTQTLVRPNKIRILWILYNPKQIISNIKEYFKHLKQKITDYDQLDYDYGCIIDHATMGVLSKTNYDIEIVKSMINEKQEEFHREVYNDDVQAILDTKKITPSKKIKRIQEYIK